MIIEGILTTLDADGQPNIAPMGPVVDGSWSRLTLRPFQSAHSYGNLVRTQSGVFHVVDDVELLARAAVDRLDEVPPHRPAETIEGVVLVGACRWYELVVERIDDSAPRAEIDCRVQHSGQLRDFVGFNRAKHAVVEAAILASRVGILPADELLADFAWLWPAVNKTGDDAERRAMRFLDEFIHDRLGTTAEPVGNLARPK